MKSRQNSPIANCDSEQNPRTGAHYLGTSSLVIITLLLVTRFAVNASQDQTPQEHVIPSSATITKLLP